MLSLNFALMPVFGATNTHVLPFLTCKTERLQNSTQKFQEHIVDTNIQVDLLQLSAFSFHNGVFAEIHDMMLISSNQADYNDLLYVIVIM